jgi:RNA polymerase sigma-70 factor (ECF subfamily)
MGIDTLRRSQPHETADVGPRLEEHRRELRSHCRRMLGSGFEADDAVQETLVRAWRAFDRFEGRSSLRSWLYRIATNVCLDMLEGQQRRPGPMDLHPCWGSALVGGGGVAEMVTGRRGGEVTTDPAEVVTSHEAIRQAFVVALQTLPHRQRAVLILRDVLRWRTEEVAELLGSTATSVNSALQRARKSLAANANANADVTAARSELEGAQRHLLARYVDAFERSDVQSLVALLRLDHLGPPHDQGSAEVDDRTAAAVGRTRRRSRAPRSGRR